MSNVISFNDIPITLLSRKELIDRLKSFWSDGKKHHLATINPEFIVRAYRDQNYSQLLASVDLATADGAGIILMARIRGYHASYDQRQTGVDVTDVLLHQAYVYQLPVGIIVPRNTLVSPDLIKKTLLTTYPSLKLTIGYHDDPSVIQQLTTTRTALLFVTLGSPDQELWIQQHITTIPQIRIAVGVGGTFDFISGTMHRAPAWMRTNGLEWLWRLMQEPKRFKRIICAVFIFPWLTLTRR